MSRETEFELWKSAAVAQRSYLVEVLHWFHYRTTALKRSWAREEVITWELLRALELLPQSLCARPILALIASRSEEARKVVEAILTAERVAIVRYPSLKLTGSKRNCRSDIGFGRSQDSTLWLEVKTAPFKSDVLQAQLEQQRRALAAQHPSQPTAVATLLPRGLALKCVANIGWDEVQTILKEASLALKRDIRDSDLRSGYEAVAEELAGRISTHPNGIGSAAELMDPHP